MTDHPEAADRATEHQWVVPCSHGIPLEEDCPACFAENEPERAANELISLRARLCALEAAHAVIVHLVERGELNEKDSKRCDANPLCSLLFAYETVLQEMRKFVPFDPMVAEWVKSLDCSRDEFVARPVPPEPMA